MHGGRVQAKGNRSEGLGADDGGDDILRKVQGANGWQNGRAFCHRRRRRAGPSLQCMSAESSFQTYRSEWGEALHGGNFTEHRA